MKKIYIILFLLLIIIIAQAFYITRLDNQINNTINSSQKIPSSSNLVENVTHNISTSNKLNNSNFSNNTTSIMPVLTYDSSNISIYLKEVYSSGATIVITDLNEPTSFWFQDYYIEKKENNEWCSYPPKKDLYFDKQFLFSSNNIIEQKINWNEFYGHLPSGTYRIKKIQLLGEESKEFYSNEFEL